MLRQILNSIRVFIKEIKLEYPLTLMKTLEINIKKIAEKPRSNTYKITHIELDNCF